MILKPSSSLSLLLFVVPRHLLPFMWYRVIDALLLTFWVEYRFRESWRFVCGVGSGNPKGFLVWLPHPGRPEIRGIAPHVFVCDAVG